MSREFIKRMREKYELTLIDGCGGYYNEDTAEYRLSRQMIQAVLEAVGGDEDHAENIIYLVAEHHGRLIGPNLSKAGQVVSLRKNIGRIAAFARSMELFDIQEMEEFIENLQEIKTRKMFSKSDLSFLDSKVF